MDPLVTLIAAGRPAASLAADLLAGGREVPVPLGIVPAAALFAVFLYLGLRRFRAWSRRGDRLPFDPGEPVPLAPLGVAGGGPAAEAWASDAARRLRDGVGTCGPAAPASVLPSAPVPGWPEGGASGSAAPAPWDEEAPAEPGAAATLWTPRGARRLPGDWTPTVVAVRPRPGDPFGLRTLLGFLVATVLLLAFHTYLFFALDRVVAVAGRLVFWPGPWPGIVADPGLRQQLPDYILLVYLALFVAFASAAGLFTDPRFPPARRRSALLLVGAYLLTEVALDVFFFAVSDRFVNSAALVTRALVGGLFFALLLFALLDYPQPIAVRRLLPRDRRATGTLLLSVAVAVALSVAALYGLYRFVGLGRLGLPFAVLLLVPLLGLTVWGAIGRILYELQLLGRPVPTLEEYHPSVTVLIPAYDEAATLAATVAHADAAAALYPGPVEIVVANDGSTDRTAAVAREAVAALAHADGAVVDLPHGGKSHALNAGLRVARGELVVRVDADARLSTAVGFGALVGHLADPEVGAVQGLLLPLQTDGWTRKLRFLEIAWNHLFLRRAQMATRTAQVVDGAFSAFRRADLLALGGWVPWNGEDTEITLRLQRLGYRARFEPAAAAFEDVPPDLPALRRQRIRWNRGGLFAHRRHLGALFGDAFEFGGLALAFWLAMFVRSGLRGLVWVYAAVATLLLGLPTLATVAAIAGLLLLPRGCVLGYYLVRYRRARWLPWIAIWPATAVLKQYFTLEALGSIRPGARPEYAE